MPKREVVKKRKDAKPYQDLVQHISTALVHGQSRAMAAVHSCLVETYWQIGQYIVEYEQQGQEKAVYGSALLENLSRDLKLLHGKGFSRSNLNYMRLLYIRYPICETPSHKLTNTICEKASVKLLESNFQKASGKLDTPTCAKASHKSNGSICQKPSDKLPSPILQTPSGKLENPICATLSRKLSWSHYVELLKIDDDLERSFYEQQTQLENWSVAELKRQKNSALFLRLALSKEKDKVLQLSKRGQIVESPEDIVKDLYVFEFLKIPEPYAVSETDLEAHLLDNLQSFLLELGKGFTFVARQFRMTINNTPYRVDLVFYHRILRCFVLIDLKIRDVQHGDIGQMNMYMGYFDKEENTEGDNPPIGIILSKEKDELLVEYATYGMDSRLFVSKYQLYLPNAEELKRLITRQLAIREGE